ncbi:MAG: alpha-glucan family phosphorylase [Pseudomonadota bacterium]|nr:alpha-glucan family phosphorylase [Pseudomonadota bacterium]
MTRLDEFTRRPRIAYFSMEIALRNEIPTYSGGLGVLAGDTLRAGADLELPLVAVTLVSRRGYFRQEIDAEGRQIEHPDPWDPGRWAQALPAKVAVPVAGQPVWVQAWLYVLEGSTGYPIPVILLDTDLADNAPADREITHYLYGGDAEYRLKQEMVLGIGGTRMLRALGFEVHTCHMNEGHSALLALELLRRFEGAKGGSRLECLYDVNRVRELCLFTTHTPVEAGHDQFPYELVERVMGDYFDIDQLKLLAGHERLNLTRLALSLSGYVNGVAKRHAEVSAQMFAGYRIHAITNGVHPQLWTCESVARLYDAWLPEWRHEPEILVRADAIPEAAILSAHQEARRALTGRVRDLTGVELDPDLPIIGFARRMTGYKRPDLLFTNPERLAAIARRQPFQVVLAGKAHPRDDSGRQAIQAIHRHSRALADVLKIVFLPNYDLDLALAMVSGADLWLNTPQPPLEASGTSGMKAALNGVINLSTLDGWWLEGCIEGVTGWAIGGTGSLAETAATDDGDAAALYDKLEHTVLPLYYNDRGGWVRVMKGAISKNAYYFNSLRMMRRYATEAYIR